MAWRKVEIYILTVLLLAVALLAVVDEGIFFRLTGDHDETIRVWEKSSEEYYVFLPSYGSMDCLNLDSSGSVSFDGLRITRGMSCESLEIGRPYALNAGKKTGTITFLQSENVGTMYIDTISGNTRYIRKKKGNKEPGSLRLYTPEGELDAESSLSFIKARGNSTFLYAAKKAYSLKLSKEKDLLGMGAAEKWILLADAFDSSHIRNKMVLDFAGEAGLKYSPQSRWVDLYLNGEYAGLYLLTERNELAPGRVEVSRPTFLVSAEAPERMEEQNLPHITLDSGTTLRIRQSDMDEKTLEKLWQSAENAILAADGVDSVTGKQWSQLIDLDSWTKKYLLEEIFGNPDGGRISQYYYLDGGDPAGKICAGPAWDYDYAMANRNIYQLPAPNMLYMDQQHENPRSVWFPKLYQEKLFYDNLRQLYKTQFSPLLKKFAEERIWQYADMVSQAASLDQRRWDTDSSGEELVDIQIYLSARMEFLNRMWIDGENCIEVEANWLGRWATYAVFPGETLPPLPQREGFAWYISGTDTPFDPGRPILKEMSVELRPIG